MIPGDIHRSEEIRLPRRLAVDEWEGRDLALVDLLELLRSEANDLVPRVLVDADLAGALEGGEIQKAAVVAAVSAGVVEQEGVKVGECEVGRDTEAGHGVDDVEGVGGDGGVLRHATSEDLAGAAVDLGEGEGRGDVDVREDGEEDLDGEGEAADVSGGRRPVGGAAEGVAQGPHGGAGSEGIGMAQAPLRSVDLVLGRDRLEDLVLLVVVEVVGGTGAACQRKGLELVEGMEKRRTESLAASYHIVGIRHEGSAEG